MAVSSVGDIVLLSQLAWRVARAFKAGGTKAPADFLDIYDEADGLSESLRLLAETLHKDGDLLKPADISLQHAVATILQPARTTLEDLDSLTDRYRVVRKIETQGGFVVEKHWSDIVLANYKQMIWTAEKGNLQALRDMLHMHANTISLTTQALQSESIAEIEKMVVPVANTVECLHDKVDGSMLGEMDHVHRIIARIDCAPFTRTPPLRRLEASHITRRGSASTASTSPESPPQRFKRFPYQGTGLPSPPLTPTLRQQSSSTSRRPSSLAYALSASSLDAADHHADAESATLQSRHEDEIVDEYLESMSISNRDVGLFDTQTHESHALNRNPFREARRDSDTISPSVLARSSNTGSVLIDSDETSKYRCSDVPITTPSPFSSRDSKADRPETCMSRTEVAISQEQKQSNFLKQLFRNSAKLFDGHADLVEFTQEKPEEPDPRFATELVPVATGCRVLVVRKKENLPHGGLTYATSIWTIADDFSVRVQQRLPEVPEPVPWSSFFSPEKVSLSEEINLYHHSQTWGEPIIATTRTNWINYMFKTADAAANFQSAIFGRKLLGTFKTEKTTVHHQGLLRAAFAFEEQMCGIETLRLWEEDGVSLPGAAGGVLALIHFSPSFGESWCQFWINSSTHPVDISDDSGRHVKIKNIDLGVIHIGAARKEARSPASSSSSIQKGGRITRKKVSGMRIEFSSLLEKARFLEFVARVRRAPLIALPDCRVSGDTIRG